MSIKGRERERSEKRVEWRKRENGKVMDKRKKEEITKGRGRERVC